jgi:hypothetical protein
MAGMHRGARMAERRAARGHRWSVIGAPGFDRWLRSLDPERSAQVMAALRRVAEAGPGLGRPRVDSIQRSRVHNLKELRVHGGVRVLFAFDPDRRAVMLAGGDKTGTWNRWYRQAIPVAERAYADHLRGIGRGSDGMSPGGGREPPGRSQ